MRLLNRTIFFLFILLLVQEATAQTSYGIKGGFNWVTLDVKSRNPLYEKWGYFYRPAFHIGFYSTYQLTEKVSFNPELLFSNKGHRYDATSEGSNAYKHLNYINLPLLAGFRLFTGMNLVFGPEAGYLLNGEAWNNKVDVGLTGGATKTAGSKISIGLRYSHGLTTVIEPGNYNLPTTEKVSFRNQAYQLSLGYKLN